MYPTIPTDRRATSARWQILGALAAGRPLPVAWLARKLGANRQNVPIKIFPAQGIRKLSQFADGRQNKKLTEAFDDFRIARDKPGTRLSCRPVTRRSCAS